MHPLNNPVVVGKDFYAKPVAIQSTRLENVFNVLFGTIPNALNFAEEFEFSCLEKLLEVFEHFSANIVKTGTQYFEEGTYIGKPDSSFSNMLISVDFRSPDGEAVFYESGLFGRIADTPKITSLGLYVRIKACSHSKEQLKALAAILEDFKVKEKSKIYMLSNSFGDLTFSALTVPVPEIDLSLNYGEDFLSLSDKFVNSLNTEKSGLYLFHGAPGTGKSSYIKYLCSGVVSRKIVYIPVGLIPSLTSPDMMPLLMENKDIVLVIEDAEKALVSRDESGRSDLVSTILNLTDGFLGHALNITVVATFNTAKEKIDEALLRKGRLKHCYEFGKLSKEQACKLADSLNLPRASITESMTLADIYNLEVETGYVKEEEKRVGFF
jgi:hypothetical protein